ncbi:putative GNAT family acetyltransferase [Flammeovirgaceae bacterium 311]|nr:putative GNAT family acetyltransferase [Flammeovirgaceae bacterium 311]
MVITYRQGTIDDLCNLKKLALVSWGQFQPMLTIENWNKLNKSLMDDMTFIELLNSSICFVCTTGQGEIIGMTFLVPSGNPTDIYDKEWCYIRFVTVHPNFGGQGIGRKLTTLCIDAAKANGEKVVALHTSEFMSNAIHIYESLGFEVLKEIDRRLGKRYWLYKLDLE